jgi:adenine phosphoribosyltransferase
LFTASLADSGIGKIVCIDARGFLFGSAVAYRMGIGMVPVRKRGKLPYRTRSHAYALEYGEAEVEMHIDAIRPGERVALVDDLLATGGTSAAAAGLIQAAGGIVHGAYFLIELGFLDGRKQLPGMEVVSYLRY